MNEDLSKIGIRIENIRVDDLMEVTRDSGTKERRRVKYIPWQLGDGTWVIGLRGIAGGYALSRCRFLEEIPPD